MIWQQIHQSLDYDELEKALGLTIVQRTNRGEHIASCPLPGHGGPDRNPSFAINVQKGVFGCFACQTGGSIPRMVMELHDLDWDGALRWLSQFSSVTVEGDADSFIQQLERWSERQKSPIQRDPGLPWYSPTVLPQDEPGGADYFTSRNIGRNTVNKLDLRFVGCRSRAGYTGPCVVIPHYFDKELRGWQERWVDYGSAAFPKHIPKYTNSDSFPKKQTLYRFGLGRSVILVESALTVATLDTYGFDAIASFGASVSPEQIRLLRSLERIYLAYDNDEPGRKARNLLADALGNSCDILIVKTPEGQKSDLGDVTRQEVKSLIANAQHSFLADL